MKNGLAIPFDRMLGHLGTAVHSLLRSVTHSSIVARGSWKPSGTMSLPAELRVLCGHLATASTVDLPRLSPTFLRLVLQCRAPLSLPSNPAKTDTNLVHKLKTQISSLLAGKSPEGRFAAVVLIKGVVEVGGWEILKTSEPWVRGLLSILSKSDPPATKELCIVTLTKIYCMTQQYPTLLREITTPTLPGFITSSLNLVTAKNSPTTAATIEIVLQAFAKLLPRHPTLYRPFVTQIRAATKLYLAPTSADQALVPLSLQVAAQSLTILLHQTVAKGGGGEQWGKSFRQLIREVHITADNVLRAVLEDWESTAGYVGAGVDLNEEISGGGHSQEDLSAWTGIVAGTERLKGLLQFLCTYFKVETSTPVAIPLGAVVDLIVRLLSVAIPATDANRSREGPRLNPAVDRDEKDALWSYMPEIYVATLELIDSMVDRLQSNLMSLSPGLLNQISWVFSHGKHSSRFRDIGYQVITKLLTLSGMSLNKAQVSKLNLIIRTCCNDLQGSARTSEVSRSEPRTVNGSSQVADSFLQQPMDSIDTMVLTDPALALSAATLLPVIVGSIPQQFLDISLRSLVERTAILTHNKGAMLECVLNPFVGKNGAPLASIVPHLTQAFGHDSTVEILLRPRMPLVAAATSRYVDDGYTEEDLADQEENMDISISTTKRGRSKELDLDASQEPSNSTASIFSTSAAGDSALETHISTTTTPPTTHIAPTVSSNVFAPVTTPAFAQQASEIVLDTAMTEDASDSSDAESVHLTMQLDTDSESEVEE